MEWIFHLDKIFGRLIAGSSTTILLLLYALKIIAKETKWTEDDKIVGMVISLINKARGITTEGVKPK